jgi:predicted metalloprotease with PDZ domain
MHGTDNLLSGTTMQKVHGFTARRKSMSTKVKIGALAIIGVALMLLAFGITSAKKYRSDSDRPWIGVYTERLDRESKEASGLKTVEGVVIVDVADDSPAEEAGLRRKDVIVKFDGKDVTSPAVLKKLVATGEIGKEAQIVYLRKGTENTVAVKVAGQPDIERVIVSTGSTPKADKFLFNTYLGSGGGRIGVSIQDLNDQLGEYFGVHDGEGVLITEVSEDSPAQDAGLKAGDVIVSADKESITETGDLQEYISDMDEGDTVAIGYLRKGVKGQASVEVTEESYELGAFTVPDINIKMPKMPKLNRLEEYYSGRDLHTYREARDEYREQMQELREQMKEMEKELQDIREKLD